MKKVWSVLLLLVVPAVMQAAPAGAEAGDKPLALSESAAMTATTQQPNLLFVLVDQWRRQALGFMNEDPVVTPHLDRFAEGAAVFNNAVATVPVCTPCRAVLITGNYPLRNGVLANGMRVDENSESLGVVVKKAGYYTGYIGKWHIDGARSGFIPPGKRRQGFDFWQKAISHTPFDQRYYVQDDPKQVRVQGWGPVYATDTAIEYMKENGDKPFSLVVSYGPPHRGGGKGMEDAYCPGQTHKGSDEHVMGYGYKAPPEFEALYRTEQFKALGRRANVKPVYGKYDSTPVVPGYFGAITSLDHEFGRLMDYLEESGLDQNTIVVFTSDHGEMMGSQGLMMKCSWYDESAGIPCLIRAPGVKPQRVQAPFGIVDMMPTLLGLMGVQGPDTDGVDFSPLLTGREMDVPEFAFLSFYKGGAKEVYRQWRAVYSDRYAYVAVGEWAGWNGSQVPQNGGVVLYDRETDPYQINPIYRGQGQDELMDRMHQALAEHLREQDDPFLEKVWVARADKTGAPDTARYDALVERYYTIDLTR